MTKSAYQKLRKKVSKIFKENHKEKSLFLQGLRLGSLLSELNYSEEEEWTEDRQGKLILSQLLLDSLSEAKTKLDIDRLRRQNESR